MSPEVRQRATEPFFSTKGKERGTGLGLAMVHGFVQQSLGRLEIDTEPGRGTTRRLLFTVAPPEEAGSGPVQPRPARAISGDAGGRATPLADEREEVRRPAGGHSAA